ncbi:polysaccharide pyruvyl transferase family protein [Bifidobacterium mongoliense]|uniref:polysaccharide pyruvyl transferase family protein n=1 Tax=Bifidobacterium mongoliense TaxID=518643 RepID=UPI0030EC71D0
MATIKRSLQFLFGAEKIGYLRNIRKVYCKNDSLACISSLDSEGRCFVLGAADYGNLGDIAISYAQERFLSSFFHDVFEIQTGHFWEHYRALKKRIRSSDLIVLQGGGNMGDLYEWFEIERCEIISLFPNNPIIIFPQTIDYRQTDRLLLQYSQKTYAKHGRTLHIAAREQRSYVKMKAIYSNNDVVVVPDIVLSLGKDKLFSEAKETAQNKILLCIRNDHEKADLTHQLTEVDQYALLHGIPIGRTDTVIDTGYIPMNKRYEYLSELVRNFRSARLVVTDRLHGMVIAALAGVPCLALSNSNGKVEGVYQWLDSEPNYVRFAGGGVSVTPIIEELLRLGMQSRDVYPADHINSQFAPLTSIIGSLS